MSRVGPVVGLDIGGTKIHGCVLDGGRVATTARRATARGVAGVVSSAADLVEVLCRQVGLAVTDIAGVGAGLPGVVDTRAGLVSHAVNMGITEAGVPLASLLSGRLGGTPVVIENDLSVATIGAAHLLDAGDDVALLSLGTGLAAGLMLHGELRRGFRGGAGEIGHITYVADGAPCHCGQRGCLELYASGAALAARWPSPNGRPASVAVFDAAAHGNPDAVHVRDEFVAAVAAAVRMVTLTCDVEHVLIGGGVAEAGAPLLDGVAGVIRGWEAESQFLAHMAIADRLRLVPAELAAAPVGAALAFARVVPV